MRAPYSFIPGGIVACVFCVLVSGLLAQPSREMGKMTPPAQPPAESRRPAGLESPSNPKISSMLSEKIQTHREKQDNSKKRLVPGAVQQQTTQSGETIKIIIKKGKNSRIDPVILSHYKARVLYSRDTHLGIEIPVDQVENLSRNIPDGWFMRLPRAFESNAVIGEGVAKTGADFFHGKGFTGNGISIAVIDIGFKGLDSAVSRGDLPQGMVLRDFTGYGLQTEFYHGTQCAEIVHDMAPDAQLHLLKIGYEIELIQAFEYCMDKSVDIISMSIGTVGSGPGNGTGTIHELCAEARQKGILIVASAGNYGVELYDGFTNGSHWEGRFTDQDGDNIHEFRSSSIEFNAVGAIPSWDDDGNPSHSELSIMMRWDDWPLASSDYDLHVYDYSTGDYIASSAVVQDGTTAPVEYIGIDIPDEADVRYFKIEVTRKNGTVTGKPLEIYLGSNCRFVPYLHYTNADATSQSSLGEPADSKDVLAVGAIDQNDYTAGPQEDFSSQGPTNAWAGSLSRMKPDLAGPDGIVTGSGNTFFGTSASAPHVAGAAAVILSRYPELSNTDLRAVLVNNAIDMGTSGQDNIYGYGRLNLDNFKSHFVNTVHDPANASLFSVLGDEAHDRVYVGSWENSKYEILVIDTVSESVVDRIDVGHQFSHMAISKDGNNLALGGNGLHIVNLETREVHSYSDHPLGILSVAFDYRGNIIFSDYRSIHYYDVKNQEIIDIEFDLCPESYPYFYYSILKTDASGRILYCGEKNEGKLTAFSISGARLSCLNQSDRDAYEDFDTLSLSTRGNFLYTDREIINAETFENMGFLPVAGIEGMDVVYDMVTDASGRNMMITTANNYFEKISEEHTVSASYDLSRFHARAQFESNGAAFDRTGRKLFYLCANQIYVLKNTMPLSLDLPFTVMENYGVLTGKGIVRISEIRGEDTTITLESLCPDIEVPGQIIIPAGSTEAVFDITVHDDDLIEQGKTIEIMATIPGQAPAYGMINLLDDETFELTLDTPGTAMEASGGYSVSAGVLLNRPAEYDMVVDLHSSDTSEITVPWTVTIPAGQTRADFNIQVIDDTLFDDTQIVTISAQAPGAQSSDTVISLQDNEEKKLALSVPDILTDGVTYPESGIVSIPGQAVSDVTVYLGNGGSCRLILPDSVVIKSGNSQVFFDLRVSDDQIRKDPAAVEINATASGWSEASGTVYIVDNWLAQPPQEINDSNNCGVYNSNYSQVAALADGGFVIVWSCGGASSVVRARTYNDNGTLKSGDTVNLSETSGFFRGSQSVISLSNGGFAVSWRFKETYNTNKIALQVFDKDGVATGSRFIVEGGAVDSPNPVLRELSDGRILWNWDDTIKIIDPVNDTGSQAVTVPGISTSPDMAALPVSGFIAVWSKSGIMAQGFDADGAALTGSHRISATEDASPTLPGIEPLSDGRFIVSWTTVNGDTQTLVYRVVDSSGEPVGLQTTALTFPFSAELTKPTVKKVAENTLMAAVVVNGAAAISGVWGQLMDLENHQIGSRFLLAQSIVPAIYSKQRKLAFDSLNPADWVYTWVENGFMTKIMTRDTDMDDDGITDALEDANNNGCVDAYETDPLLTDTDGDGIQDGTESGLTLADIDPYTDLAVFRPDADPLTKTAPFKVDSDEDGMADNQEDLNLNGRLDPGESEPDKLLGDLNYDFRLGPDDAAIALKILNNSFSGNVSSGGDADADGKIGILESIYVLRKAASE